MRRETELIRGGGGGGGRNLMKDLEGNVNRADAEKTFQAVFFYF